MRWYNFETAFTNLRDDLRFYLKANRIKYELSGTFGFYHFEIFCSPEQAEGINNYLDTITIKEVR